MLWKKKLNIYKKIVLFKLINVVLDYNVINDINEEMKIHKIKLEKMEERLEEIEFMDKFKYN